MIAFKEKYGESSRKRKKDKKQEEVIEQ
jgi:hypothetical protein